MYNLSQLGMNGFCYTEWLNYLKENDRVRLQISFSNADQLSGRERKLIFPSIRAFQKGEGSDGKYLMQTVRKFAAAYCEPECIEVMRYFIREENCHSAYLKGFMNHYGVPPADRSYLDRIFRSLRKHGGFQREVIVLVTAEIIALSYYTALGDCTGSPMLKGICQQMLHDELPHIVFQSYNLSHFFKDRRGLRKLLMTAVSIAEWWTHRAVYRSGGYSFVRFLRENHGYLKQSVLLIDKMKKND